MALFPASRYFAVLFLLNLHLKFLAAGPNLAFQLKGFGKDSNFESQVVLYGDAKVVNGGVSLEITGSGRVFSEKPIKLVEGNPRRFVSFYMSFEFSMTKENGDGLAFVMVPVGFPLNVFDGGSMGLLGEKKMKFLAVEFDTHLDEKYGDLNGNHIGLDIDSFVSVKVGNVSSIGLVLNNGEKLQAWIDYQASSKRLEVRLGHSGDLKPVYPLLSYPLDLSQVWKEDDIFVGLSSSSGNSSQRSNLYSWSFESRTVPQWMHSEPVDPAVFVKGEELNVNKRRDYCALRIIAALIFGTGCGALGAFIVLFVWTLLGNRRPVVPEEYVMQPKEFEYKKFSVVVDETTEDGKK